MGSERSGNFLKPLVSILVPAYCHEDYIDSCIDGLISQTYDNIEVLLCDDKSPDDTYKRIEQRYGDLKKRFDSVKIFRNDENLGVCRNLNFLISQCHGDYIKGIASDDILLPNAIEDLVHNLEMNSQIGAVVGNGIIIGTIEQYPLENIECFSKYYVSTLKKEDVSFEALFMNNTILAPAVMFRRKVFDTIGLFDETLYFEDYEYWLRMTANGIKIGVCDVNVVAYRVHGKSLSHFEISSESNDKLKRMFESRIVVIDRYANAISLSRNVKGRYSLICSQSLEEAFNADAKDAIDFILNFSKKRRIRISVISLLKLICYRLRILKIIQGIRKSISEFILHFNAYR